jgi:predicted nucleic acid-binding protein
VKFADTSWWVAWSLPGDRRHNDALAMLEQLGPTEQVLTTNLIVGETWTFLRRKDGHRSALGFLDRTEALTGRAKLAVHRVTPEQEEKAWSWLRKHDERPYSFVDATSFQVMRDRRLREALAFDHDFAAAGFIELGW